MLFLNIIISYWPAHNEELKKHLVLLSKFYFRRVVLPSKSKIIFPKPDFNNDFHRIVF